MDMSASETRTCSVCGKEGHDSAVPAARVELAEAGAGESHHQHNQPAWIPERFDLVEAFLYLPQIEQLVFSKDHDVLHFRHDVHVNAAVMIFTGGGQALSVFNGGQHNGI